jgi:hypothetical protein
MRFKMQLENLTLMLLCIIALLAFFVGLMLFVRFSLSWLVFENVADTFYFRILGYLGASALPLLLVNVLLNFLMYLQARVYQMANYEFPPLVVDNNKFIIRTITFVSSISLIFLIILFFVHMSNLSKYENKYHDDMVNSIKSNKNLLQLVLQNTSNKKNAFGMANLTKPLLENSSRLRIIVPLSNEFGKKVYRFLDDLNIPVEYDDKGKKLPVPTEFEAYANFYDINSKYFRFYSPTKEEELYFDEFALGNIDKPFISRDGDHFRVIYGISDPITKTAIFVWSSSEYFRKGEFKYFQF